METVVRNIQDLPQSDRLMFERIVGHPLRESEQLVIQVMGMQDPSQAARNQEPPGTLPAWCDVYEGLSEEEIDELDRAIVRSPSTREIL